MVKKKPKTLWAARVNLSGLVSVCPIRVTYRSELEGWWDKTGEFDVTRPGIEGTSGSITFSSENKKEVQTWIEGACAVMQLLQDFSRSG